MRLIAPLIALPLAILSLALAPLAACAPPPPADVPTGDEGEGDVADEPIDLGSPPIGYEATPASDFSGTCSTNQYWQFGDAESDHMHPGGNCMECHAQRGGPRFFAAGTIMGRSDDGTDCRGMPNVQIDILDVNGNVQTTLHSNNVGNFFAFDPINTPYTVKLTAGDGTTSEMTTHQTSGNCMECHTPEGLNGAPGRIIAPR